MTRAFSVASWNVEHFGKYRKPRRVGSVVAFAAQQDSDILAIYEVENKRVFRPIIEAMPDYHFFITEGEQTQEILIGIRHGVSAYATQNLNFKSGQSTLRPGVLVTVHVDNAYYPVLFLHLKSMRDPRGFGLRHDMIRRAYDFQKTLTKASKSLAKEAADFAGEPAPAQVPPVNYIFVGDLNTMGLDYYPRSKFDIQGEDEIAELRRFGRYRNMRLLEKNAPATYYKNSASTKLLSNLDHVVAADHLQFEKFNGKDIDVRGWPGLATEA